MEKETLEKIKNGLKKFGTGIVVMGAGLTMFTACDRTSQEKPNPGPNTNPGGNDKPPVEVTQYSVSTILSEMQAFKNLDVEATYDALAMNIADEKLFEAITLGYEIKGNTLAIVAKSKDGGELTSVCVSVPSSATKYAGMSEAMLKQTVLLSAGYNTTSTVENKAEAEQKLTVAINKIVSDIAAGKECTTLALNEYTVEGANINLSNVFSGQTVKGYVREDGTVLAYVYGDKTLTEHHYRFTQNGLYTNQLAQIIENGEKGVDYTEDVVVIDLTKKHNPPALEQQEVETITVGEIFDQNFADLDFSADIETSLQKLYGRAYRNLEATTLFYSTNKSENKMTIYFDGLRNNKHSLVEFEIPFGNLDLLETDDLKIYLLKAAGLDASTEVETSDAESVKNQISGVINSEKVKLAALGDVSLDSIQSRTLITKTQEISDHEAYAKKLYDDREIVYAGVSDLGGKAIDESHFNTGYYDSFNLLSIYYDGDNIIISTKKVYVPYKNGTTAIDRYNEFLLNDSYDLGNEETITITDPVEVQRLAEFLAKVEKFSQYKITGLDGLAEDEDHITQLYSDAYTALWMAMKEDATLG